MKHPRRVQQVCERAVEIENPLQRTTVGGFDQIAHDPATEQHQIGICRNRPHDGMRQRRAVARGRDRVVLQNDDMVGTGGEKRLPDLEMTEEAARGRPRQREMASWRSVDVALGIDERVARGVGNRRAIHGMKLGHVGNAGARQRLPDKRPAIDPPLQRDDDRAHPFRALARSRQRKVRVRNGVENVVNVFARHAARLEILRHDIVTTVCCGLRPLEPQACGPKRSGALEALKALLWVD